MRFEPHFATMSGMRLQFSLATLLLLVAVAGIVARVCISIPVNQRLNIRYTAAVFEGNPKQYHVHISGSHRSRNLGDASLRMAWALPSAIAATLAILSTIRRLKCRREDEPREG